MMKNTTGQDLVDHWSWAAKKGIMKKNTANTFKSACFKVLDVLDDWESTDITSINIEDTIDRFKNLHAREYHPKSLEAYGKRFKRAIESYLAYIEDPGAWKPASRQTKTTSSNTVNKAQKEVEQKIKTQNGQQKPSSTGLIDYPFPLREGVTVRLMLPRDIAVNEVKRLNAFMSTLVIDFNEQQNS